MASLRGALSSFHWRARKDGGPAPLLGRPVGAVAESLTLPRRRNVLPRWRAVVERPDNVGSSQSLRRHP
jgi:hypothetical protein